MADYKAPLQDIRFVMNEVFEAEKLWGSLAGTKDAVDIETADAILEEAGKITASLIAPLSRNGDEEGCTFDNGKVTVPSGYRDAYKTFAEGGWSGLTGNPEYEGMGMPKMLGAQYEEMLYAADISFGLYVCLTSGAALAIDAHASEELKQKYLPKMYSGEWTGAMGIHTHDNLGLALSNTLRALDEGVTWVDSTVTGMGRGPGNARTEELAIEIAERRGKPANMVPLMVLLREHFKPMQAHYGWGTNPYYYLAGKYGIHPTYIQEMLSDSRYSEEDVLAVIEHLRVEGGKKFSLNTLDAARHFYRGEPKGQWSPKERFAGREVLLLGTGPGVARYRGALERYIRVHKPLVLALNTQSAIEAELIDLRVACHPVRLLADCEAHTRLPQPLITPYSMLPADVRDSLGSKEVLDFGLNVRADGFAFEEAHCTLPTSLVVGYALAVATSGQATRILMAGFDGYGADDPRSGEMHQLLEQYQAAEGVLPITAITPTRYGLHSESVYAL